MMNAINRLNRPVRFFCLLLLHLLLTGVLGISAQDSPASITIGENQIGSIADANSVMTYSLSVDTPQSVEMQVLAITSGFAPTFVVLDPGGEVVLDAANPGAQTVVQGTPDLYSPGTYTIEVSSANGAVGQFLISLQPGELLVLPLTVGENQVGTIADASVSAQYVLSVDSPLGVNLQVLAVTAGFAPSFRVLDPDGSVIFEAANAAGQSIAQGIVNLPGAGTYQVEVRSANATTGQYLISVQPGAPLPTPTASPTPEAGSVCTAAIYGWYTLHEGPGTQYPTIEIGNETDAPTAMVFGYFAPPPPDWKWYKVFINSKIGWLVEPTFALGENCDSLPLLVPPPTPTPTATNTPIPGDACMVEDVLGGEAVYTGPSTSYFLRSHMLRGQRVPVLGHLADSGWFLIDMTGFHFQGWVDVSDGNPTISVPCNVPDVQPPSPNATPLPILNVTSQSGDFLPASTATSPGDVCMVAAYLLFVPIYSGPSTSYSFLGYLLAGDSAPVVGHLADSWWYLINASGLVGWVSVQWGNPIISLPCNVPDVPSPPPPTSTLLPGLNVTSQSSDFNSPPPAAAPDETCMVQSASRASINVRRGPSTGYDVVGQLPPGVSAPVIGRLADNSWFQVTVDRVSGWVSASVVTLGGNCAGIAIVQPPAPPPTQPLRPTVFVATSVFRATSTLTPTGTPTPTSTPNPLLQVTAIIRPGR